jgi:hypothetical protein
MCRCQERRQIIASAVKRDISPRVMVRRLGKTVWQDASDLVVREGSRYWPTRKTGVRSSLPGAVRTREGQ